jgi:hypothetical protein
VCGVSNIGDAERKCHAHKHLFMGSENRTALIMQFQPFAVASSDGFLGNVERREGYDRLNECNRDVTTPTP